MEVAGCCFPDDRLYDADGLVWVRLEEDSFTIGMTQLQVFIVGKVNSIVVTKQPGLELSVGRSVAYLETPKYAGNLRTPIGGTLEELNGEVLSSPSLLNSDPYGKGWIAKLRPTTWMLKEITFLIPRQSTSL